MLHNMATRAEGGQIQDDPIWFVDSALNEWSMVSLLFPRPYEVCNELITFYTTHARKNGAGKYTVLNIEKIYLIDFTF